MYKTMDPSVLCLSLHIIRVPVENTKAFLIINDGSSRSLNLVAAETAEKFSSSFYWPVASLVRYIMVRYGAVQWSMLLRRLEDLGWKEADIKTILQPFHLAMTICAVYVMSTDCCMGMCTKRHCKSSLSCRFWVNRVTSLSLHVTKVDMYNSIVCMNVKEVSKKKQILHGKSSILTELIDGRWTLHRDGTESLGYMLIPLLLKECVQVCRLLCSIYVSQRCIEWGRLYVKDGLVDRDKVRCVSCLHIETVSTDQKGM